MSKLANKWNFKDPQLNDFIRAIVSKLDGGLDQDNFKTSTLTLSCKNVRTDLNPETDDFVDLGSPDYQWKDLYVDGLAYIDGLGENLDCNSKTLSEVGGFTASANLDIGAYSLRATGFIADDASVGLDLLDSGTSYFLKIVSNSNSNLSANRTLTLDVANAARTFTIDETKKLSDYILKDGSRALTSDWDAGSHKITAEQLESDIATGTAPLIVASTTVVTNLNADLLDGKNTGTSGNAIPLLDGTNTWSGTQTIAGTTPPDLILDNTTVDAEADSGKLYFKGNYNPTPGVNLEKAGYIYLTVPATGTSEMSFYVDNTEKLVIQGGGDGTLTLHGAFIVDAMGGCQINNGYPIRLMSSDEGEYGQMAMGDQDLTISTGGTNDRDIIFAPARISRFDSAIHVTETTTPTAIANYGAFYTKDDNEAYFQDGAGTEHTILTGASAVQHAFFVPLEDPTGTVGNWDIIEINSAQAVHFTCQIPEDFEVLDAATIVMIPDTTETIQWDVYVSVAAAGEAYNNDDRSALNQTLAVTANQITEADISGQLTGLSAGDYVAIDFQSDTANLRIIGFEFDWN